MIISGRDKLIVPRLVTDETKTIRARPGTSGSWVDVDLVGTGAAPWLMYPFYEPTYTAHDSLFTRLVSAFGAALGSGSMAVEAQDQVTPEDTSGARVSFQWDGGVWQVDLGACTVDVRGFGGKSTDGVITSDATGRLNMPWSCYGVWMSSNLFDGFAQIKDKATVFDVDVPSPKRRWVGRPMVWDSENTRTLRWYAIQAARVLPELAHDPFYANLAYLTPGDDHATLWPVVEGLLNNRDVLAVYNMEGGGNLGLDGVEVLTLFDSQPLVYPDDVAKDTGKAGKFYTVEMTLRIAP